ncbi:MAG TPA: serine hydrolase [Bacillota bacterium]|nr:serine hydrolase [Bacillota bacterium]HQD76032.1 serine hydrolase [Bacillota bacterium]HUM58430.1 serine hydrolase [Bacillota bacterium]
MQHRRRNQYMSGGDKTKKINKEQETPNISAELAINTFIEQMNKKAKQIGMTNSNFIEPAGFPSTIEHTMSTRDMVKMAIHASGYKVLTEIWNKKSYKFKIEGNNPREITIKTTVSLPVIEKDYYIYGGKTGEIWGTNEIDGYHMVLITSAPNGRRFVVALRGASTAEERCNDLKTSLDNAKLLLNKPDETVSDISSDSVSVCLMPLGNPFSYGQYDIPLIYSKNADKPGHPASVTKVMTAITALDYMTNLDEKIVVQESDITFGMGNYFNIGDIITFRDALYSMMLPSSNTCATAVARTAGERIYQRIKG